MIQYSVSDFKCHDLIDAYQVAIQQISLMQSNRKLVVHQQSTDSINLFIMESINVMQTVWCYRIIFWIMHTCWCKWHGHDSSITYIAFSSTSWSIENRCEKCSNNKYLQRAACKHWTHHFPFFSQYISMHSNVNMSILVAIKYTNRLVSLLTIQRTSIRIGWNFPQDFRRRQNGPPIS